MIRRLSELLDFLLSLRLISQARAANGASDNSAGTDSPAGKKPFYAGAWKRVKAEMIADLAFGPSTEAMLQDLEQRNEWTDESEVGLLPLTREMLDPASALFGTGDSPEAGEEPTGSEQEFARLIARAQRAVSGRGEIRGEVATLIGNLTMDNMEHRQARGELVETMNEVIRWRAASSAAHEQELIEARCEVDEVTSRAAAGLRALNQSSRTLFTRGEMGASFRAVRDGFLDGQFPLPSKGELPAQTALRRLEEAAQVAEELDLEDDRVLRLLNLLLRTDRPEREIFDELYGKKAEVTAELPGQAEPAAILPPIVERRGVEPAQ